MNKADGTLGKLLGHKYDNFKAKAGALLAEIDRTAPQIVSDGIRVIAFGAAGEAAVGAALKGASKLKGKLGNVCDKNFPGAISEDLGGVGQVAELHPHKEFGSTNNVKLYNKYKVDGFEWAAEYNDWMKTVDPSFIQEHHIFSNKGKAATAIRNHPLFKEGLIDVSLLDSEKNIMPLPSKPGLHPTMTVHKGGRHTNEYKADMNVELDNIRKEFLDQKLPKQQIEKRFWDVVNAERTRLYTGNSKIYKTK